MSCAFVSSESCAVWGFGFLLMPEAGGMRPALIRAEQRPYTFMGAV